MRRWKQLDPHLLDLEEMHEEQSYLKKRQYRLDKLQRMGKNVEPDLAAVSAREHILDIAIRERRNAMSGIDK